MSSFIFSHYLKVFTILFIAVSVYTAKAQNLIVNGDFSSGNTGFVTTDIYCNTSGCLFPYVNNAYAIGTNPNFFHTSFFGSDHTSGTGNMMCINGGLFADVVWSQTVNVTSNTSYSFSAWVCSIFTLNTAALGFSINGVNQGSIAAPPTLNLWQPFSVTWNSGASTSAAIEIRALNTSLQDSQNGVDFGLDDIKMVKRETVKTSLYENIPNTMKIFPNPVLDKLHLETSDPCLITLYDAIGRVLLKTHCTEKASGLDMSAYPKGIYTLTILENEKLYRQKIIKAD